MRRRRRRWWDADSRNVIKTQSLLLPLISNERARVTDVVHGWPIFRGQVAGCCWSDLTTEFQSLAATSIHLFQQQNQHHVHVCLPPEFSHYDASGVVLIVCRPTTKMLSSSAASSAPELSFGTRRRSNTRDTTPKIVTFTIDHQPHSFLHLFFLRRFIIQMIFGQLSGDGKQVMMDGGDGENNIRNINN